MRWNEAHKEQPTKNRHDLLHSLSDAGPHEDLSDVEPQPYIDNQTDYNKTNLLYLCL